MHYIRRGVDWKNEYIGLLGKNFTKKTTNNCRSCTSTEKKLLIESEGNKIGHGKNIV